jgi:hypothetical protein
MVVVLLFKVMFLCFSYVNLSLFFVMCDAKEVLAVGGGGNVYAFYIGVAVVAVLRRRGEVVVVAAAGEE